MSTFVNPFSAITTLSNEAVSKSQDGNNPSPHYFFFENKEGIHFRSLQSLYEQDTKELFHVGDMGFDEDPLEGDPESGKLIQNFRRILSYEIRTRKDLFLEATAPTCCLSFPVILIVVCFSTAIFIPWGISKLTSWL